MAGAHLAVGDSLAAGEIHIVHAGNIHHRVARIAQQQGGGHQRLGDGGENQAAELPQQGVRPAAGGEPLQLQGKDNHQQQSHPEGGHGDGHQGGGAHRLIPQAILVSAGEVAQRQADQQGEYRTHQGKRQGHRKPGGQQIGHRYRIGEGIAEVQGKDLLEEEKILGEQRLIQAQLLRQGCHRLFRGFLTQNQPGGLTGNKADDGEHQNGDHKQHRDHLQDPFQNIIESIQRETPASVSSGRPPEGRSGRGRGVLRSGAS